MESDKDRPRAPDGGWGYLCVIGMTQSMLLFGLAVRSYGVIYLITLEKFETTATIASGIGAANVLIFGLVSPFAAILCQKVSCRLVAFVGTIGLVAGFIMSAFAYHVAMMYISFGLLCGVGTSFTTTAGFLIVSQYFEKKRALALSLGSAGASISVFIMPPLTDFLFDFYGYRGGMGILAGISLQGFVSAALFKPLDKYDIPTIKPQIITVKEPGKEKMDVNDKEKDTTTPLMSSEKDMKDSDDKALDNASTDLNNISKAKEETSEVNPALDQTCSSKFEILKNPLLIGIILVNIGMTIVATTANTFAPALAVDEGISKMWAVLLLSWAGLSDTIGRITIGLIMDMKKLRPYRLYIYTLCGTIGSIAVFIYPLVTHYGWYTFSMVMYEGNIGVLFAQRTTVLADVIGMKKMPVMFGALQTINALGITFGRGLGGIVKDKFGIYNYVFYISGIFSFCCLAIMLAILINAASRHTYPNKAQFVDSAKHPKKDGDKI